MNINELLIYGRKFLLDTSIQEAPLKIRLLAESILKMNKYELVINHLQEINNDDFERFKNGLEQIKNNTPIQYITNNQEFMKLNFYVDENVLIPQPDTEILVENVIKYCSENSSKEFRILDLCTGSGAIAVSLAKYIPNCKIVASDISSKALQVAKLNTEKNQVIDKVEFIESDMFENIKTNDFDIIVSNPPYIEKDVIETLSPEVQKEPHLALDGGNDGLSFYRIIISQSSNFLKINGKLFLEIGYNQKEAVFKLIENSKVLVNPVCMKDLEENDRVIICEKSL